MAPAVAANISPAPQRQKITMWFWGASPANRQALQDALVRPFNTRQSQYELQIEYRTSVDNDVRIAAIANRGPDIIFTSGPGDVWPLARAGKLEPMDAYAARYGWADRLLGPVLDTCRQEGHLYCVTPSVVVDGMFYNKAVLGQNHWSVPTNEQELEAVMRAAEAKGLYASVTGNAGWQPVNQDYLSIFMNTIAGPVQLHDVLSGKADWTSPGMVAAMSELDRWYKAGYLGGRDYFLLNFDTSLALLRQGRSPFFFAPSFCFQWAVKYFTGAQADDLGFAPFPRMRADLPYPIYDVGSAFTFSINANSRVREGAAQVLDMILTPEFVLRISRSWPGYWSIPLKYSPEDPGASGVVQTYYRSLADISAAVRRGAFGYNLAAFFPNRTKDLLVQDIEAVWLSEETPRDMLVRAGRVFAKERARGAVLNDIAAPHF